MGLYTDIGFYAKRLKKAAKWNGSGEAVENVYGAGISERRDNNYVYEFFIYLSVIDSLLSYYDVVYQPDVYNRHTFPKGAASKRNFPHFKAYDIGNKYGEEEFQICMGTEILNVYGQSISPDVSFQKSGTGNDPKWNDLILVYDAKYKADADSRLPTDEVRVFLWQVLSLRIDSSTIAINMSAPFDQLRNCAVITNGRAHADTDQSLVDHDCLVAYDFYPGKIIGIIS